MAGVKGKSGRQSKLKETRVAEVIDKGFRTVERFLEDETQPLKDRAQLGAQFALKKIADRVEQVSLQLKFSDSLINRILQLPDDHSAAIEAEAREADEPDAGGSAPSGADK